MSYKSDLIDIPMDYVHDTEKAWLLSDGDKEYWIPKSRCEYDQQTRTLTLPEPLAKEKGLV